MSDPKRKRKLDDETKLSPNIPLPNIVRIEILNKFARSRYLGTLQQISNTIKDDLVHAFGGIRSLVFYGFMKGNAQRTLDLSSSWQPTGDTGGGILGTVRALVAGGTSNFKGDIGQALELGRDLTGISMNTTGSASIKRYNGSELNQFSVDCGWYLPEQHKICIKSLKAILRIAYPTQLDLDNSSGNNIADTIGTALSDSFNYLKAGFKTTGIDFLDSILGLTQLNSASASTQEKQDQIAAGITDPANSDQTKAQDISGVRDTVNKISSAIINKNVIDLFGKNLTFDPLPVRCSIGQFIDIEPLVISGVSVTLSNETFVNSDGRHLPIFVSINIQFKFWMQPPPNFEFMKLLGEEMFG